LGVGLVVVYSDTQTESPNPINGDPDANCSSNSVLNITVPSMPDKWAVDAAYNCT
jgi:hypothetical protein